MASNPFIEFESAETANPNQHRCLPEQGTIFRSPEPTYWLLIEYISLTIEWAAQRESNILDARTCTASTGSRKDDAVILESEKPRRSGPLAGLKIVEIASLGPTPYAGMLLSDMGADVIRVDRPGSRPQDGSNYVLSRGRRSIVVDLKQPDGADTVVALAGQADALIEGYRPGVAERLG